MNIMLKDFIRLLTATGEEIRVFDINDNLLYKGEKTKLLSLLSKKQTFATRKIFTFYFTSNTIYIIIE